MPPPEPISPEPNVPSPQRSPVALDPVLASRALEALGNPLVICDASHPDTPIVYVNPAFEAVTGYPQEQVLGRDPRMLQGEGTDPAAVGDMRRAIRQGRGFRGVLLNYRKDGSPFWNEMSFAPIRDGAGALTHWASLQADVSERVQVQEASRDATARLETLIASLQAGVIVEDDGAQLILANRTFCDMMDIEVPPEALTGANVVPLARATARLFADPDAFIGRALELRRRQERVQSEELRLTDGRVWERDYAPVFPDGAAPPGGGAAPEGGGHGGHLWVFRDVTERRRIEQQARDAERQARDAAVVLEFQKAALERANAELEAANARLAELNVRLEDANARLEALATTDGLTGLSNQRVFAERLAEEFRRSRRYAEPLSLILLDVDRFKAYNDSFGHLAGNAVLRRLAGVLQGSARETDLAARFGGEEFALVLPHTDLSEAVALAERLRAAVESASRGTGRAVTASLGVCELTRAMADPEELVARADAALYRAKAGGRNRVEQ